MFARSLLAVHEPGEQRAQTVATPPKSTMWSETARRSTPPELARTADFSAFQVVEHERGQPREARVREGQCVAEALLERDRDTGARSLAPRARERLHVGVEPDEVDARLLGLGDEARRSRAAAEVEDPLSRRESRLRDQPAQRGPGAHRR